jgi:transposase
MSKLHLTATQQRRLEQQLRATQEVGLFRRTLAVLEAGVGRPIAEIARLLRTTRVSVHHWIQCYQESRDPRSLADSRGGNHPTLWTEELVAALTASLARRPESFGYQAVEWTVPLLQDHLQRWTGERPSTNAIRQQLHELDYVWKRPRYVLAPDPEEEKKTADSPGNPGLAGALGEAVRGRDGPAALPAAAGSVGRARPAPRGADLRAQCAAGDLWDD